MRGLLAAQLCATAVLLMALCAPASADVFGPIALVSNDALEQANYAHDPAISGDGRYVAFDGFFDGRSGVWRRDLHTGAVEPVAVGEPETPEGDAELPSISQDGRYVSFTTRAALAPSNDRNIGPDVYVRDMDLPESQQQHCEETALHPEAEQACPFVLASAVNEATLGLRYEYSKGGSRENEEEEYGSLAVGRSALSADGREVVFVTSAPSDLAGVQTPPLEVVVRHLDTGVTQLVSVEGEPHSGAPIPGRPVPAESEGVASRQVYGAVYSGGKRLAFNPPQPYAVTAEVPASISADGSTVAWLAQNVGEQAPTLSAETLKPVYSEPLWRRIADGEDAPTLRVAGGSDPANPACAASGEVVVPETPSLTDPCQGPFATTTSFGVWTGGLGDAAPRLSADGYAVAFIANAPLASLGNDFGVERTTRHSDLYVADMHAGLSRAQALTPLTELASGAEEQIATNARIIDLGISPDGGQVAFTTERTVFPLGAPAYVSAPASVPGLLELFDVDTANDTLTSVTRGYEGGASEHPHPTSAREDQYEEEDDGALSPYFSANGEALAFSSTASNLVYGDGNTPPLGYPGLDGSDAFVVHRILFDAESAPQTVSSVPANPSPTPEWSLGVTGVSLANGSVRLYVTVPGAGTLRAVATGAVTVHRKARPVRGGATVVTRNLAATRSLNVVGAGGLTTLVLTLAPSYRSLSTRSGGLSAVAGVTFAAPGHPVLRQSVVVTFVRKARAHASARSKARGRRRR